GGEVDHERLRRHGLEHSNQLGNPGGEERSFEAKDRPTFPVRFFVDPQHRWPMSQRRCHAESPGSTPFRERSLLAATVFRGGHAFGLRAWLNCCKALLTNRRTTFLELVWLG